MASFDFDAILGNDALFEIVLPFILIFTIIFAVMQTTKVLGGKKNIDAIISLVFGLLLIRNQTIVETINRFLPNISLLIVVILMILLVVGVFAGGYEWSSGIKGLAAVLAVIVVLWIFGASYWSRFGIPNLFSGLSSETRGILAFLAILVVVIFFVTRDESNRKGIGDRLKDFGDAVFKK